MTYVNIFLLCSEELLYEDELEIRNFIESLNSLYSKEELHFQLCADENNVVPELEEAKKNNQDIKNRHLFIFLIYENAGQNDLGDSFETGNQFMKTDKAASSNSSILDGFDAVDVFRSFMNRINIDPNHNIMPYSDMNIVKQELITQIRNLGLDLSIESKDNDQLENLFAIRDDLVSRVFELRELFFDGVRGMLPDRGGREIQENFDDAVTLYHEILEIDRELIQKGLTEESKNLINNIYALADLLSFDYDEDNINEAEKLRFEALEIMQRLTAENPSVINEESLASAYLALADSICYNFNVYYHVSEVQIEPENCYRKALEIRRKLAREHPSIINDVHLVSSCTNLAEFLESRKDAKNQREVEGLYWEALDINRRLLKEELSIDNMEHIASSCTRLADLLSNHVDEESQEDAEGLYREALNINRRLLKENFSVDNAEHLALSCTNLADFFSNHVDEESQEEAEGLYWEALDINRRLLKEDLSIDSVGHFASSCIRLAEFLESRKDAETQREVEELYGEILDNRLALVTENPAIFEMNSIDEYMAVWELVSSYYKMADLLSSHIDEENQNEIKKLYQGAVKIRFRVFTVDPSLDNEVELADSREHLADFLKTRKDEEDLAEAENLYRKVLKIKRKAFEDKENSKAFEMDIAVTCNNLADLLSNHVDDESQTEAEELYREALDIRLGNAEVCLVPESLLAVSCSKLANVLSNKKSSKDQTDAEDLFREALDIRHRLAKEDPSVENDAELVSSCNDLADFLSSHKDLERKAEAEKLYWEALDITRRLARENPAYESDLAKKCHNLADLLKEHMNTVSLTEAKKLYREELEIRYRLAEGDPSIFADVASTCMNLANLLSNENDVASWEEAQKLYMDALKIRRGLAKKNPSINNLEGLVTSCTSLANHLAFHNGSEGQTEAENLYNEAIELEERLVEENPTADNKIILAATYKDFANLLSKSDEALHRRKLNDLDSKIHKIKRSLEEPDPDRYKRISRFSSGKASHVFADDRPKSYKGEKPYVFISYAHKNDAEVYEIIRGLQKRGLRISYDEGIEVGSDWSEFIEKQIEYCDCFFAMLTREYEISDICRNELTVAINTYRKPRVFIYLEDIQIPSGFRIIDNLKQNLSYYEYKDKEKFLDKIADAPLLNRCWEESDKQYKI